MKKKTNNKKVNRPISTIKPTEKSNQERSTYFNPYAPNSSTRTQYTYSSSYQAGSSKTRKNSTTVNSGSRKKDSSGQKDILNKQRSNKQENGKIIRQSTKASTSRKKVSPSAPLSESPELRRQEIKKNNHLSKQQIKRLKKRKQRRMILKVAVLMCLTTFLVWGIVELKELLTKPKISYQVVHTGTIDNSVSLEGVILRKEEVIYSDESGNVQYVVSEGEKVKKDGIVYVLMDEQQLVQTTKEQQEVDQRIYDISQSRKELSKYQDQIYNLDQSVRNKVKDYYDNRYEESSQYIYNLRNQLDQNIRQRTSIYTEEQQTNKQQIATLKAEIEADLGKYRTGKLAPQAGIVSYKIDGIEDKNIESIINEMDYKKFNEIIKRTNLTNLFQDYIEKDMPVYKLVLDNKWNIVCYTDIKSEEDYVVGQNYLLDFSGIMNKQVNFKLISKKEEGEKHIQLVFETNDQLSDFLELRYAKFTIGNKDVTGLKIPLQAIVEQNLLKIPKAFCTEKDGKTGVYRKIGETTEFISIKVQYQKDDAYYCLQDLTNSSVVQVNDILVNPNNSETYQVSEIETKQGVYVINGKIAEFKVVDIDVTSGEYAIIKYGGESELKELDKIISNPKGIKINQLLEDMSIQNE